MMPYERLKAWEACHALWLAVAHATKRWPIEERFGLASQIRRASLSAAANIVEGTAKRGQRDCARHLNISIGSLAEVHYLLRAAIDVSIIDEAQHAELLAKQQEAGRLTMGLYRGLQKHLREGNH
jgi:four helix bundle protein